MSGIGSDLPVRLGVGVVLIGVALASLWFADGLVFGLLLALAGVLMVGEWAGLVGADARERRLAQYAMVVALAIMSPLAAGPNFFTLGVLGAACFFVAIVTRNGRLGWGLAYVGLPIMALLLLRAHPEGFALTLWTMAIVWASDTGAYFAGRAIGGPKLAPAISPNKTWAGSIGGVVAAVVFTIAFVLAVPDLSARMAMIAVSPVLAVLSQAGDLYESHLKRMAGVKDSGDILPGHGGLLDRLDGLVPVAPAAFLVLAAHHHWLSGAGWW